MERYSWVQWTGEPPRSKRRKENIATGRNSCRFGPSILGEPSVQREDLGGLGKTTTNTTTSTPGFPTPGMAAAAAEGAAAPMCEYNCCCASTPGLHTPGPTYDLYLLLLLWELSCGLGSGGGYASADSGAIEGGATTMMTIATLRQLMIHARHNMGRRAFSYSPCYSCPPCCSCPA